MRFTITGSGGCVSLPRPLCQCSVCVEARKKGFPYARCGCSLYLHDANLLVDTPEDIAQALNHCDIRAVDTILYSHWDPDHTMGMRVMEQLRLEWLDWYRGQKCANPIDIYSLPGVLEDVSAIQSKYGSFLGYYEQMGLIRRHAVTDTLALGGIKITMVPVPKDKNVAVFVFESAGKKLIYAPCDCLPFPDSPLFYNADILVIGNTFPSDTLKNGEFIGETHPLRSELYGMENAVDIQRKLNINEMIITHLEEDWGRSYDEYRKMESGLDGIRFAFDGMEIEL